MRGEGDGIKEGAGFPAHQEGLLRQVGSGVMEPRTMGPSPARPREPRQLAEGPGGGARPLRLYRGPAGQAATAVSGPGGALESEERGEPLGTGSTLPRTTAGHQAPLSMGFPWQEYWSGFAFPTPKDRPDSGIEPGSLVSPALVAGRFFATSTTWEAQIGSTANSTSAVNRCEQIQQSQRG